MLRNRQTQQALIHHLDRGAQYCSSEYQHIHRHNGLQCSLSDGYDCCQKVLAERVNGILKNELLLQRSVDLAQLRRMVCGSVDNCKQERP